MRGDCRLARYAAILRASLLLKHEYFVLCQIPEKTYKRSLPARHGSRFSWRGRVRNMQRDVGFNIFVIRIQSAAVEDFKKTGRQRGYGSGYNREYLADISNLTIMEIQPYPGLFLPALLRHAARKKNGTSLHFQSPCKSVGLSIPNPDTIYGLGAKTRNKAKNFPNLASFWGCRRRKFPYSNPRAKDDPRPPVFNLPQLPIIFRHSAFPISSLKYHRPPSAGRRKAGT